MPSSCGLSHRPISTLLGFIKLWHLSWSRVHSLGNSPSQTPTIHFYHAPFSLVADIQKSFLQAVLHSINPLLPWPTHSATTSTLSYIDPLTNTVILHSLHMAELLENTFINLFINTLHHCTIALFMDLGLYPFS